MRNTTFLYYCFVFTNFIIISSSTKLLSQPGDLLFHHLKLEDGLSELNNEYVYKDSKGFVWISSVIGLNRFDGTSIKQYFPDPSDSLGMIGELVQSPFFEDTSGHMWFATHDAIIEYDQNQDNFHNYRINKTLVGYSAIYLDPQSDLWFITDTDTSLYTLNVYSHHFNKIRRLAIPVQRAIVVPDKARQVSRIYGYMQDYPDVEELRIENSVVVEECTLMENQNKLDVFPKKLLSDSDSILWIVGTNQLIKYNWRNSSTVHLPMENILTIGLFNDSTLFVSILNQGIYEFDKRSLTFRNQYIFSADNTLSLLNNTIYFISRDRDQGYWFCASGHGISYACHDKKKFNTFNPFPVAEQQLHIFNPAHFLMDHSENFWCSGGIGVGIFELGREGKINVKIDGSDPEARIRINHINKLLVDRKNHFWVSSYSGISFFSSSFDKISNLSFGSEVYLDMTELQDGSLIFSSGAFGLFRMNWDKNELEPIMPDSLKATYSSLHLDSRARIWACENQQNIIILDSKTWKKLGNIQHTGGIGAIVESADGKTIWVAGSLGLYEIDAVSLQLRLLHNSLNGFSAVGLTNILIDKDNKLWITSNSGLIEFDPETNHSTNYNFEDGLPSSNFNTDAAYQWSDGEMWFGSSKGITKFRPDEIKPIDILAIPQITDILVNDQTPAIKLVCEQTGSTNISEIRKLTFSYRDNTLTFIVNSLEYSAPKNNKVRYWMEGMDTDSIETSSGSRIRYTNLPSRKLVFCMQAANSDGQYNPFVRKLEIAITPPFYKTWWFITLASLALLSLIIYIVYLNFSKRLELQKVRLRLYENLHDDVGSRLTAIVFSADELLHQDKTENPKVQQISKTARSIVDNMRRLVWAIDPENDTMNSMVQKIRHDKNMILNDQVEFHLNLDDNLSQVIVPGEIRYQVTSIVNEALNNISKYARAKNVWVSFNRKNNVLTMIIRDDGVGFNPEDVGKDNAKISGYGLGNMKKRVNRVKGNINLVSKHGEGTTIQVTIPFK